MSREIPRYGVLLNTILFATLFAGAAVLRLYPTYFDHPVAKAINGIASGRGLLSQFANGAAYPTVEGVLVLSLVWCCWFSGISPELRARLVCGVAAAVIAAFVAHLLQHILPVTPKPIFDPTLDIRPLDVLGDMDTLRQTASPDSPTFPSERGTLFAGLAIAILQVNPAVGLIALGCTIGVESCRIYLGLHYPTDIIGSFCLAASVVWCAEMGAGVGFGRRFMDWERASASTFYLSAFFVSYHLATAFQDLRALMGRLLP